MSLTVDPTNPKLPCDDSLSSWHVTHNSHISIHEVIGRRHLTQKWRQEVDDLLESLTKKSGGMWYILSLEIQDQTSRMVFRMIHTKDSRSYLWAKFGLWTPCVIFVHVCT